MPAFRLGSIGDDEFKNAIDPFDRNTNAPSVGDDEFSGAIDPFESTNEFSGAIDPFEQQPVKRPADNRISETDFLMRSLRGEKEPESIIPFSDTGILRDREQPGAISKAVPLIMPEDDVYRKPSKPTLMSKTEEVFRKYSGERYGEKSALGWSLEFNPLTARIRRKALSDAKIRQQWAAEADQEAQTIRGQLGFGGLDKDTEIEMRKRLASLEESRDERVHYSYKTKLEGTRDSDLAYLAYGRSIEDLMRMPGESLIDENGNLNRDAAIDQIIYNDRKKVEKLTAFENEVKERTGKELTEDLPVGVKVGRFMAGAVGQSLDMVQYAGQMMLNAPGVALAAITRFNEMKAGDFEYDENGEIVVTQEQADSLEAILKSSIGAWVEYKIEKGSIPGMSKLLGGAIKKARVSRLVGKAKKLSQTNKAKSRMLLEKARKIKGVSKPIADISEKVSKEVKKRDLATLTGIKTLQKPSVKNLIEEVIVEEGGQAIYDAIADTEGQGRIVGEPDMDVDERLGNALVSFGKSIPEMTLSMLLFGSVGSRLNRFDLKRYLNAEGVSKEQIDVILGEEDPDVRSLAVGRAVIRRRVASVDPDLEISDEQADRINNANTSEEAVKVLADIAEERRNKLTEYREMVKRLESEGFDTEHAKEAARVAIIDGDEEGASEYLDYIIQGMGEEMAEEDMNAMRLDDRYQLYRERGLSDLDALRQIAQEDNAKLTGESQLRPGGSIDNVAEQEQKIDVVLAAGSKDALRQREMAAQETIETVGRLHAAFADGTQLKVPEAATQALRDGQTLFHVNENGMIIPGETSEGAVPGSTFEVPAGSSSVQLRQFAPTVEQLRNTLEAQDAERATRQTETAGAEEGAERQGREPLRLRDTGKTGAESPGDGQVGKQKVIEKARVDGGRGGISPREAAIVQDSIRGNLGEEAAQAYIDEYRRVQQERIDLRERERKATVSTEVRDGEPTTELEEDTAAVPAAEGARASSGARGGPDTEDARGGRSVVLPEEADRRRRTVGDIASRLGSRYGDEFLETEYAPVFDQSPTMSRLRLVAEANGYELIGVRNFPMNAVASRGVVMIDEYPDGMTHEEAFWHEMNHRAVAEGNQNAVDVISLIDTTHPDFLAVMDAENNARREAKTPELSVQKVAEEYASDFIAGMPSRESAFGDMLGDARDLRDELRSDIEDGNIAGEAVTEEDVPFAARGRGENVSLAAKRQIESDSFKRWFGNSKVVDENGKPLVVYRGDYRDVGNVISPVPVSQGGSGAVYFTSDYEVASGYAQGKPYSDSYYDDPSYIEVVYRGKRVSLPDVKLLPSDAKKLKSAMLSYEVDPGEGASVSENTWNYRLSQNRNNPVMNAIDIGLQSGVFNRDDFVEFLKGAGIFSSVRFDDPSAARSNVTPVYLSIQKPFDIANASRSELDQLRGALGEDHWFVSNVEKYQSGKDTGTVAVMVDDQLRLVFEKLGYDGIIDQSGGSTTDGKQHDVYMVFSPEQIKSAIGNRGTFSAETQDIRFAARKEDITTTPGLVVLHNLSEKNIRFIDEMDGQIAMPSIAISSTKAPISGFGEISLVANKELVDPRKSRSVRLADADIYSPRYPSAVYQMDKGARDVWSGVESWIKRTYGELGDDSLDNESYDIRSALYGLGSHLDSVTSFSRDGVDGLYRDIALQAYWSDTEKGRVFKNTDSAKTYAELREFISKNRSAYESWVRDKFAKYVNRQLFRGFTPSGNRRYSPYTIENVMREMRKQMREEGGESTFYGAGTVRSRVAKRFRNLSEVQRERDRLVSSDELSEAKDEFDRRMVSIADLGERAYNREIGFGFSENFWTNVMETRNMSPERRAKELETYGFDDELMPWDEINAFLEDLRNAQTEYFEAKVDRVVGLNEFSGAVVPSDVSPDIVEILEKYGIADIERYESREEGSRAAAVNRLTGMKELQFAVRRGTKDPFRSNGLMAMDKLREQGLVAPGKAKSGQEWMSLLSKRAGVKGFAKEAEWTGLDKFLSEGKRTPEEVEEFMRDNQVVIQEVMKGNDRISEINREIDSIRETIKRDNEADEEVKAAQAEFDRTRDQFFSELVRDEADIRFAEESSDKAQRDLEDLFQRKYGDRYLQIEKLEEERTRLMDESAPKYSDYKHPGGSNYRELLVTMPSQGKRIVFQNPKQKAWEDFRAIMSEKYGREIEYNDPVMTEDERVEYDRLVGEMDEAESSDRVLDTRFRSSHWDEPNVLYHVRFQDVTDADGKKVLLIEEIQSDLHQKGRKNGYKTADYMSDVDAASEELVVAESAYHEWFEREGKTWTLTRIQQESKEAERVRLAKERLVEARRVQRELVPDFPFKKDWHEHALKRMMRFAAENGYDKLAWTPGEVQAERYDLSKQVDDVEWNEERSELYARKDGSTVISESGVSQKNLADYVGKEVARKLLDLDADSETGGRRLSGVDLKTASPGMVGFYDRMLPAAAKKLFKATVGQTSIYKDPSVDEIFRILRRNADVAVGDDTLRAIAQGFIDGNGAAIKAVKGNVDEDDYRKIENFARGVGKQKLHSIDVTPELTAQYMQSQPMFAVRRVESVKISDWALSLPEAASGTVRVFHSTDAVFDASKGIRSDISTLGGGMSLHVTPEAQNKYGKRIIALDVPREDLSRLSKSEWVLSRGRSAKPDEYIGEAVTTSGSYVKPVYVQPEIPELAFAARYHGTPHVLAPEPGFPFGRFRLDKIGTGEGSQVYGWGIYFAEAREVAETYRQGQEQRSRIQYQPYVAYDGKDIRSLNWSQARKTAAQLIEQMGKQEAIEAAEEMNRTSILKELRDLDESLVSEEWIRIVRMGDEGNIYRLDIPDDVIPLLLDRDVSIREQSPEVRKILEDNLNVPVKRRLIERMGDWMDATGEELYEQLSWGLGDNGGFGPGDMGASMYLGSMGIPGLQYLDQQSRRGGQGVTAGQLSVQEDAAGDGYVIVSKGRFFVSGPYPSRAMADRVLAQETEGQTRNTVIWDQGVLDRIALLERNEDRLAQETAFAARPMSADERRAAARTSRVAGAIGSRAITPRYVTEVVQDGDEVLNYGAGKVSREGDIPHSVAIHGAGGVVTNYDLPENRTEGVHDPNALARKYDVVMASNVMNVQPNAETMRNTLNEIAGATKISGRAIFNYPESPRPSGIPARDVIDMAGEVFGSVERVGGTAKAPLLEATMPRFAVRRGINEQDRRYLELAKDPEKNKAELQRMVDEAAWENFGSHIADVYHGSRNKGFNHFEIPSKGYNSNVFGSWEVERNAAFFSTDQDTAREFSEQGGFNDGEVRRFILLGSYADFDRISDALYNSLVDAGVNGRWINNIRHVWELFDRDQDPDGVLAKALVDMGYEGVKFSEEGGDTYAVLQPENIKLADPVTYDDSGNVVPLSKRFDPEQDDIRFAARSRGRDIQQELGLGTEEQPELPIRSRIPNAPRSMRREPMDVDRIRGEREEPQFAVRKYDRAEFPVQTEREYTDRFMAAFRNDDYDGLDKARDDWGAFKRAIIGDFVSDNGEVSMKVVKPNGQPLLLTRSTKVSGNPWRVTVISSRDNGPLSHDDKESYSDALEHLLDEGVDLRNAEPYRASVPKRSAVREPLREREEPQFAIRGEKSLRRVGDDLFEDKDSIALGNAKAMAAKGKSRDEIFNATGWWQGEFDGKWRIEIDDSNMLINEFKSGMLSDVMIHNELFDAYPDLKTLPVKFIRADKNHASYHPGRAPGRGDYIEIFGPTVGKNPLSVFDAGLQYSPLVESLMHEVQHAIQHIEGFATGSNPDVAAPATKAKQSPELKAVRKEIRRLEAANEEDIPDVLKGMTQVRISSVSYDANDNPRSYKVEFSSASLGMTPRRIARIMSDRISKALSTPSEKVYISTASDDSGIVYLQASHVNGKTFGTFANAIRNADPYAPDAKPWGVEIPIMSDDLAKLHRKRISLENRQKSGLALRKYAGYRLSPGEIESDAVSDRLSLTDAERNALPAYRSVDAARRRAEKIADESAQFAIRKRDIRQRDGESDMEFQRRKARIMRPFRERGKEPMSYGILPRQGVEYADETLAQWRDEAREIDFPSLDAKLYDEIVSSIPLKRLKSYRDTRADGLRYTWEDALKRAKELDLVDDSETGPEVLADLYSRELVPAKRAESEAMAGEIDYLRGREEQAREIRLKRTEEGMKRGKDDIEFRPDEIPQNALVRKNRRWYMADKTEDGDLVLRDGVRDPITADAGVLASGIIFPRDPKYKKARSLYSTQVRVGQAEARGAGREAKKLMTLKERTEKKLNKAEERVRDYRDLLLKLKSEFKERMQDVKDRQDAIIKYANKHLTREQRGRAIAKGKSIIQLAGEATRQKQFDKIIDAIDKMREEQDLREAMTEFKKLVDKIKKIGLRKFPRVQKEGIQSILDAVVVRDNPTNISIKKMFDDMERIRVDAEKIRASADNERDSVKKLRMYGQAERMMQETDLLDAIGPDELKRILYGDGKRLKDMSIDEILYMNQFLKVAIGVKRDDVKRLEKERAIQKKKDVQQFGVNLSRAASQQAKVTGYEEAEGKLGGKILRRVIHRVRADVYGVSALAWEMDGGKDGIISKVVYENLLDGMRRAHGVTQEYMTAIQKFIKDNDIDPNILDPKINDKKAKRYTYKLRRLDGGMTDVSLSLAELMSIYRMTMNEDSLRHILKGGISIPSEKKTRPLRFLRDREFRKHRSNMETFTVTEGDLAKMLNDIENHPEVMALADEMGRIYDEVLKERINEVSNRLLGYDIAGVDNYWPIVTDSVWRYYDETKQDNSEQDMQRFMSANSAVHKTVESHGQFKGRMRNASNPVIIMDAFTLMNRNAEITARYYGLAEPMRRLKGAMTGVIDIEEDGQLVGRDSVERRMKRLFPYYYEAITSMMRDVESGGKGKGYALPEKIKNNIVKSTLGLNLPVAAMQVVSYLPAALYIDNKYWLGAIGKVSSIDEMREHSPSMWNRYRGRVDVAMGEARSSGILREMVGKEKKLDPMSPISKMDAVAIGQIWTAVKNETRDRMPGLKEGTDEYWDHVAKRVDYILSQTQPTYDMIDRSQLQRSDSWFIRNMVLFSSQRTKNAQQHFKMTHEFLLSKKRPEDIARFMRKFMIMLLSMMGIVFIQTARQKALYAQRSGDDGFFMTYAKNMLGVRFGDLPGYGSVLASMASGYGVNDIVLREITSAQKGVARVAKYIKAGKWDRAADASVDTLKPLFRMSGVSVMNPIQHTRGVYKNVRDLRERERNSRI